MSDSSLRFEALLAHTATDNLKSIPSSQPPMPGLPTPKSKLIANACRMWYSKTRQDLEQNDGHDYETTLEKNIKICLSEYGKIPQNLAPDDISTALFGKFAARMQTRHGFTTEFEDFNWVSGLAFECGRER